MTARLASGPTVDAVRDVIRDDIRAITGYTVPNAAGLIKLDAMENPYSLPDSLRPELGARLAAVDFNRYPPANPAPFKQRLARAMGVPVAARLMLGNGSDELIHLIIQACARPGATVMAPWPGFEMIELSTRFNGCRFVGVPLVARDFSLDRTAMLAAIEAERPAVIFIAYPNNPTGNAFDRSTIEAVLDAAPGLVVLDEAYLPFACDTWMPQLERWPNLLVLRTLSKLGLAGIRLGYLAGGPPWIEQLEKVRPPYNVNVLTLTVADFMLDHLEPLEEQAAAIRAERARVAAALGALPGIQVFPSSANFLLFRVAAPDVVYTGLKERGILIKNVSMMHPLLTGCLRTTVGTPTENDAFLRALAAVLESCR
ncbi:MAG: histidinol-phosphate transaminase [Burkholderiaceae bacterium]